MLRAASEDAEGRPYLPNEYFADAVFVSPVDFGNVHFGEACFRGATFQDAANFAGAEFDGEAQFACTTFEGTASFADTVFRGLAIFEHTETDEARTDGTREKTRGRREEVTFQRWADFRDARFERGARFGGALFARRARFGGAIFGTPTTRARASFDGARFERARTFGPLLAYGKVSLDRAVFEDPVRIEISARQVSCVRTQFMARTSMEVRWAGVDLDDAEFAQPSIVSRAPDPFKLEDRAGRAEGRELDEKALTREYPSGRKSLADPTPRLRSVRRANVGNLTLSEMDLRACRFAGAHNLDGLRFEGAEFPRVGGLGSTRRRVICEELKLPKDDAAQAERIARTYRALRKGREDNKDEPGAADFYYGEMEMRRNATRQENDPPGAARTSRWEWAILNAYRGVSGYGLRASRAVAALAVTVLVFAVLFDAFSGFDPDQGYWKSLLFSAESTSSVFRTSNPPDGVELNDEGHIFQMGLRLLGPLFFGLALLALRGRVKR